MPAEHNAQLPGYRTGISSFIMSANSAVESLRRDKIGADKDDLQMIGNSSVGCEHIASTVTLTSKPQIESLRNVVGDYGIALFAPLLDFDECDHRENEFISTKVHETVMSSSCTTVATQADSESDQYRSEDDDDVDETNDGNDDGESADFDGDEREYTLETIQTVPESISQIKACPPILLEQNMQYLQSFLPFSIRDYIWDRRFAIGLHGDSFCTLLQKCEGYKNSIVVIRTTAGHILGGYASEEWQVCNVVNCGSFSGGSNWMQNRQNKYRSTRHSYYGTGQSFVFGSSILNANDDAIEHKLCVYPWTGNNDYCQICDVDRSMLCMGGVGEFGWIASDNFSVGQTGPCATYNNPPLIDETTFQIADFEIYTLISPIAQFLKVNMQL